MSRYWFWYKFWRTWMWISFIVLSAFLLLGVIIAAYVFLIQRSHWQSCDDNTDIPDFFREQLEHYAISHGGSLPRCEVYRVETDTERKRQRRRGNFRFGMPVDRHIRWSYWTKLPNGTFYPESPQAIEIARGLAGAE